MTISMFESIKGHLSFEYCNNDALKKRDTIVCVLDPFYWCRPGFIYNYASKERMSYKDVTEDHLPELIICQMFEIEPKYYGPRSDDSKKKRAGFFGTWNVKEIREARLNGLISPEQWDRLWPMLRNEAQKYDADPDLRKRVINCLSPLANKTLVEYLERELNFPISREISQGLAAETIKYANGTYKRTNITPRGAGDIVKPLIEQAVKNLVERKHPSKIYDKDIREELDNLSKDKLLPPIGNKEFYTWVGELGYQWVVGQDGRPVRSHGNRRVLSCYKSDGSHLMQDA